MLQLGVGLDVLRPVRGVLAGGAAQGVDLLQVDGADVVLQVGGGGGLRVGTRRNFKRVSALIRNAETKHTAIVWYVQSQHASQAKTLIEKIYFARGVQEWLFPPNN